MRQLTAGIAIAAVGALAVTGCAATAASTATRPATSTAKPGLAGLSGGGGTSGLARFVVDGTFKTKGKPARPLSGVVTFKAGASGGHSVTVTVGSAGTFSLGLVSGTYTVTARTGSGHSSCARPVTVTVPAGQLTRVALAC